MCVRKRLARQARLGPPQASLFAEGCALLQALHAELKLPWHTIETPRRRVTE